MKRYSLFLACAAAALIALSSACSGGTESTVEKKADSLSSALGTSARFAYALPASQCNFLFSNPSQCSLQVIQNGQAVKNFVSADLPLKITVNTGADSLVIQTQTSTSWKTSLPFSLGAQSNLSSFVIKTLSQNQNKAGGIGTIDLRDVLRQYVVDVQGCGMGMTWDAENLTLTTLNAGCICYRDSTLGAATASPAAETSYEPCDW